MASNYNLNPRPAVVLVADGQARLIRRRETVPGHDALRRGRLAGRCGAPSAHEKAVKHLSRSLEQGRLSHAYLFTGPAQVGKMSLAMDLARAVNCLGDGRPCGECAPCGPHSPRAARRRASGRRGIGAEPDRRQPHRDRYRPGARRAAGGQPEALRGPLPGVRLRRRGARDGRGRQQPAQDPGGAAGPGGDRPCWRPTRRRCRPPWCHAAAAWSYGAWRRRSSRAS